MRTALTTLLATASIALVATFGASEAAATTTLSPNGSNQSTPQIATNANGQAVAAWRSSYPCSDSSCDVRIYLEASYFDGNSWSRPTRQITLFDPNRIEVAIDARGRGYIGVSLATSAGDYGVDLYDFDGRTINKVGGGKVSSSSRMNTWQLVSSENGDVAIAATDCFGCGGSLQDAKLYKYRNGAQAGTQSLPQVNGTVPAWRQTTTTFATADVNASGQMTAVIGTGKNIFAIAESDPTNAAPLLDAACLNSSLLGSDSDAEYGVVVYSCDSGNGRTARALARDGDAWSAPLLLKDAADIAKAEHVSVTATSGRGVLIGWAVDGDQQLHYTEYSNGVFGPTQDLGKITADTPTLALEYHPRGVVAIWNNPARGLVARSSFSADTPELTVGGAATGSRPAAITGNGTQIFAGFAIDTAAGLEAKVSQAPLNIAQPTVQSEFVTGADVTYDPGEWRVGGTEDPTFTASWLRCDAEGNNCGFITDETGNAPTWNLQDNDFGQALRVRVQAESILGRTATNSESALVASKPIELSAPNVAGTKPTPGGEITPTNAEWRHDPQTTFKREWVRCNPSGDECSAVDDVSGVYEISKADVGHTIAIRETATNGLGSVTSKSATYPTPTSPKPGFVEGIVDTPSNTEQASIGGPLSDSKALVANPGKWVGRPFTELTYTWLECPASGGADDGSDCTTVDVPQTDGNEGSSEMPDDGDTPVEAIRSARSSSDGVNGGSDDRSEFVLGAAGRELPASLRHAGKTYRVRVTIKNIAGEASSVSIAVNADGSLITETVAPREVEVSKTDPPKMLTAPKILDEKPSYGETIPATAGKWSGEPTIAQQWQLCSADGKICTDIVGNTTLQHKVNCPGERRKTYRLVVKATNAGGTATYTTRNTEKVDCLRPLCWKNNHQSTRTAGLGTYGIRFKTAVSKDHRTLDLALESKGNPIDGRERTADASNLIRARMLHRVKYFFTSNKRTMKFVTHNRPNFNRAIGFKQIIYPGTYRVSTTIEINPNRLKRYFGIKRTKPVKLSVNAKLALVPCAELQ